MLVVIIDVNVVINQWWQLLFFRHGNPNQKLSRAAGSVSKAVDGSLHSQYALQMCTEWARPDKVGFVRSE